MILLDIGYGELVGFFEALELWILQEEQLFISMRVLQLWL